MDKLYDYYDDNEFYLMNKDKVVTDFSVLYTDTGECYFEESFKYSAELPYKYNNITEWLNDRQAPKHRKHIERLMDECGCLSLDGYIRITHALTLIDTFWIKSVSSTLEWRDVSPYSNNFNEEIARIAFEGGAYGEHFSSTSPEFGTDGSFAKCWIRENNNVYLMKTGSTGARNAGLEPYSEYYTSQLAKKICKDFVCYDLDNYHGKLASKCKLFTSENEGYVSISKLLPKTFLVKDLYDLYDKYGAGENFSRMVVLDALSFNVDRHTGNHGFIVDNDNMKILRAAPIFDNNLSLLPYAERDDLEDKENKYLLSCYP